MSAQKDMLLRIAAAMSAGDFDHVAEWFTEDFQLYNPEVPHDRAGHDGAHRMLQALKDLMPGGKVEILDMVEEGDRVAARMQFSGMVDGRSVFLSTVAIYHFVDSRIAEDWGIGFRREWPERVALPSGGRVQQS
jgi:predicted ester cyclase